MSPPRIGRRHAPVLVTQLHCPRLCAAGFTLIEVLVTLLVLSVGLLGLASLQIQGLRGTHEAMLHTQADTLAVDMKERLLARPAPQAPPSVQELQDWKAALAQRLPAGDGDVAADAATVTVAVFWNEHDSSRQNIVSFTP